MLMKIENLTGVSSFRNINLAKPGQNRVQQFVFVLDNDEKPGIETKEFDTSTQGRLRIRRQRIGVQENDGLKHDSAIELDVRLGEEFEVFADELDPAPASMGAIDPHDIRFHFGFIAPVDLRKEVLHNRSFSRTRGSMKNEMGDFPGLIKRI